MNILKDNTTKLYWKYFVPVVTSSLVTCIYILFDTIFIGQGVGANGLAALNIVLPIFGLIFGIGYLLGVGGSTVMGIERGKGDEDKAKKIFTLSLLISFIVGSILVILLKVFLVEIVYLLGATELIIDYIKEYLNVIIIGILPFILGSTLQGFVRVDNNPKRAMIATVTGGLVNVFLDYIFVMHLDMGMFGAALATITSYSLSFGIISTHFLSKNNTLKLDFKCFKKEYFYRIVSNGIPSFFVEVSIGIVIFLFNFQLLKFVGEVGVTAYSIISNSAIIIISILNGMCQTIQPLVSVNIGANQSSRALEFKNIAIKVAIVFSFLYALIGLLFPEFIISIFVQKTDELVRIGVVGIRIYFISFFVVGINMIIGSYFQYTEQSKVAIFISVLRGLILITVFIFILPLIFGVNGIWLSVPATEFTALIICLYLNKKLIKNKN